MISQYLPDWRIRELVEMKKLLTPYEPGKNGKPTYGQSSYGYDIRLGDEFVVYDKSAGCLVPNDLHSLGDKCSRLFVSDDLSEGRLGHKRLDRMILPPGGFCLAHSVEYFRMPENVMGLVKDKSSYARLGVAVQNTVIEPGWHGILTLEISNHNAVAVELCVHQGIAQVMFFESAERCVKLYAGRYQGQTGVTLPT